MQVHGGSDLLRRQNAEKLDLERRLGQEEQEQFDKVMAEHEEKRRALMQDMEQKLSAKLHRKWRLSTITVNLSVGVY